MRKRRAPKNPELLDVRSEEGVNVVIETPKGSHNKYKWDEEMGAYRLAKVLPAGMTFPFDFGFIPRTRSEDGDPLDVLVLMDSPAFPGCVVPCRVIGMVQATQTERDGRRERNDRLIAVANASNTHQGVESLADVSRSLLSEVEEFFINYNQQAGKKFKVVGRKGTKEAQKCVFTSQRAFLRAE